MSWQESIKFIINTTEVCEFYTSDEQLISFNKHGTLCFNRGGMWHSADERENRYKRVDLDIIIRKLADARLEPIIRQCSAFSAHNWLFLEYLDRLELLNKITYLAYSDPRISLPTKYIKKMTALQILIINTSGTSTYNKPTIEELGIYQTCLAELVIQLPPTLEILFIHFPSFNGSMSNLPPQLRILCITSNQFTQSLDYLPLSLEALILLQLSIYSNDIQNLPPLLKVLVLDLNRNYKSLVQLPLDLEYLYLTIHLYDSFLKTIGGQDCENILNLKTLMCDCKYFNIINKNKYSNKILQKTIIKNASAIHYTNIIYELLYK